MNFTLRWVPTDSKTLKEYLRKIPILNTILVYDLNEIKNKGSKSKGKTVSPGFVLIGKLDKKRGYSQGYSGH